MFIAKFCLINFLHVSDVGGPSQHTLHISTQVISSYGVFLTEARHFSSCDRHQWKHPNQRSEKFPKMTTDGRSEVLMVVNTQVDVFQRLVFSDIKHNGICMAYFGKYAQLKLKSLLQRTCILCIMQEIGWNTDYAKHS